jgi:hypothetical protein
VASKESEKRAQIAHRAQISIKRYQLNAKRADRKARQYGASNEGPYDGTDDDKSID